MSRSRAAPADMKPFGPATAPPDWRLTELDRGQTIPDQTQRRSTSMHRPARLGTFALIVGCSALGACSEMSDTDTETDDSPPASAGVPTEHRLRTVEIRTLSNRADLVSGGDVFVEVVVPDNHRHGRPVRVKVGRRDVSRAFARRDDGRITGVITGLAVGENVITADVP